MVFPPQGCPPQVLGGGKFFPKRAFHEGIFLENLSGGSPDRTMKENPEIGS